MFLAERLDPALHPEGDQSGEGLHYPDSFVLFLSALGGLSPLLVPRILPIVNSSSWPGLETDTAILSHCGLLLFELNIVDVDAASRGREQCKVLHCPMKVF